MATTVRFTVLTGPHRKQRYCFQKPARCTVGRASDCFVRLQGAEHDRLISRHHCLLEIDPPCVFVRDLGSLNGTYLNGIKLPPLPEASPAEGAPDLEQVAGSALEDGDIVSVGGTALRVDLVECPPDNSDSADGQPVWQEDEVAKRDCPALC